MSPEFEDALDFEEGEDQEASSPLEEPVWDPRALSPSSAEGGGYRHLWLISYADFMTILMIFFLVMYGYTLLAKISLSSRSVPQLNAFSRSLVHLRSTLGDQVRIQEEKDRTVLQFSDNVLFQKGKAELTVESEATLNPLVDTLRLVDDPIIVQGHTDDIPIRNSRFHSNWELSAARAFSVIRFLTGKGIAPERLAAWGFGENRPLFPNDTDEHRAQNRRIDVILLRKTEKKS